MAMSSNPAFHVRQIIASKENKESLLKLESIPEVSAIEKALAAAFDEDVFTAAVIGMKQVGSAKEMIGPFHMSTVIAALLAGEVYIAETLDTQEVVGCAVWFGLDHTLFGSPEEQAMVLGPLMELLGKSVEDWWMNKFLPGYGRLGETSFGSGKKHGSWHLQTLGVHPDHQRRGAAKQLVEIVAKKAASNKSMMVVECATDVNVDVYTRLGFKVMHEGRFITDPGMNKADCAETFTGIQGLQFKMWAMGRNPLA